MDGGGSSGRRSSGLRRAATLPRQRGTETPPPAAPAAEEARLGEAGALPLLPGLGVTLTQAVVIAWWMTGSSAPCAS